MEHKIEEHGGMLLDVEMSKELESSKAPLIETIGHSDGNVVYKFDRSIVWIHDLADTVCYNGCPHLDLIKDFVNPPAGTIGKLAYCQRYKLWPGVLQSKNEFPPIIAANSFIVAKLPECDYYDLFANIDVQRRLLRMIFLKR